MSPLANGLEHRVLHFSGHVQGVGFRYTTSNLARPFAVTGYVQNLPDGRVKLVAEGQPAELDQLESAINDSLGQNIRETKRDTLPATGQYTAFDIRH